LEAFNFSVTLETEALYIIVVSWKRKQNPESEASKAIKFGGNVFKSTMNN